MATLGIGQFYFMWKTLSSRSLVYIKDDAHQARMCTFLSGTYSFQSHDQDPSQSAPVCVRHKGLNFDRDTHTDHWSTFYGYLVKPAFAITFWKNSAINVKFYFEPLQCRRNSRIRIIKSGFGVCVSSNKPMSYPWRAARVRGFPQQLNKY